MKQLIFTLILSCHFLTGMPTATPSSAKRDSLERLLTSMPHDSARLQMIQDITRMEQTNPNWYPLLGYAVARSYRTE